MKLPHTIIPYPRRLDILDSASMIEVARAVGECRGRRAEQLAKLLFANMELAILGEKEFPILVSGPAAAIAIRALQAVVRQGHYWRSPQAQSILTGQYTRTIAKHPGCVSSIADPNATVDGIPRMFDTGEEFAEVGELFASNDVDTSSLPVPNSEIVRVAHSTVTG